MTDIYEHRCALINKNGVCDQCSQLNGIFNPKQDQQEQLMKLEMTKGSEKYNREELYTLRAQLVKAIDPLHSAGTDLQDVIMRCTRTAIGDRSDFFD
jgi:RNA polymerase sigma-70 factor (ECF subfamily)